MTHLFVSVLGLFFLASRLFSTPIVVQVAKVKTQSMPIYVKALGSLTAVQSIIVSAVSEGRIAKIFFKNGDKVGKNMPIIQLDKDIAQSQYDSSVTSLTLSQRKYERAKLLPKGTISDQSVEALKAAELKNKSTVNMDSTSLNKRTVTAPFTGLLGSFQVQVGDYIDKGNPIVPLVNTSQLRAEFNVRQELLPKLQQGQLVKLTVNAYPKKTFFGTVSFISPSVDPTTRATAVEALVQNKKELLAPGMFCHVSQQIGTNKAALMIPEQAVSADIKGYYVYQVNADKVRKVYVNTSTRLSGDVQITKGLSKGDEVVIAGGQKLQDGSTVTISHNDSGT
jgi:membrane fusion protein, multidrug efflux system